MISQHSATHSSQIHTFGPATICSACLRSLPQKEHLNRSLLTLIPATARVSLVWSVWTSPITDQPAAARKAFDARLRGWRVLPPPRPEPHPAAEAQGQGWEDKGS